MKHTQVHPPITTLNILTIATKTAVIFIPLRYKCLNYNGDVLIQFLESRL